MSQKRSSWEGTIVAFVIILTVLIGSAYSLAWTYRQSVPWLALVIVSLIIALSIRFVRKSRS